MNNPANYNRPWQKEQPVTAPPPYRVKVMPKPTAPPPAPAPQKV